MTSMIAVAVTQLHPGYYGGNNDNFLWSRGGRSVDDFFFLLRENKIRKEKPEQSLWRGYEVKKETENKKKSKQ